MSPSRATQGIVEFFKEEEVVGHQGRHTAERRVTVKVSLSSFSTRNPHWNGPPQNKESKTE